MTCKRLSPALAASYTADPSTMAMVFSFAISSFDFDILLQDLPSLASVESESLISNTEHLFRLTVTARNPLGSFAPYETLKSSTVTEPAVPPIHARISMSIHSLHTINTTQASLSILATASIQPIPLYHRRPCVIPAPSRRFVWSVKGTLLLSVAYSPSLGFWDKSFGSNASEEGFGVRRLC